MSKSTSNRKLAVVLVLAAALLPASAWAYFESTVAGRLTTPAGSGCITLVSGLQHGGENAPITLSASAALSGLTASAAPSVSGLLCNVINDSSVSKFIRGSFSLSLIKRTTAATATRPDGYAYCRIEFPAGGDWGSSITASKTYATPPCGPGYYAEIACIESAESLLVVAGGWLLGSFRTSNIRRDCNISPFWHPVMGDGHGAGPQLRI